MADENTNQTTAESNLVAPDIDVWSQYLPEAAELKKAAPEPEEKIEETVADDPETETETDSAENPEIDEDADDETALDDLPEKSRNAIKKMGKRIDKITARAKSAEELVAAKDAEIATLKAGKETAGDKPGPDAKSSALDEIDTPEALTTFQKNAQQIRRWCLQNFDGGEIELSSGESKYFTSDEVRALHTKADEDLTDRIPARQELIKIHAEHTDEVRRLAPDALDPETNLGKAYAGMRKEMAPLKNSLLFPLLVMDAVAGGILRLDAIEKAKAAQTAAEKGKSGKPAEGAKPTPPKVPLVPGSITAPARVSANQQRGAAKLAAIESSGGSVDALADYFTASAA